MALGSNNPFPSVLLTEGTTPTSPASGKQRVFANSTTKRLNRVNSAGTVVDVEAQLYDANGGYWERGYLSELLTLSTGGATTDTTANLLPADAVIEAVCARITTTITTATDWKLGDATTAARFTSANATLASGTTTVGLNHQKGAVATDAAGPTQIAAAKVRVTTTGTPGAGAIRITVFFSKWIAPTS